PPASPNAMKDTVLIQGDGWFDVDRSKQLWSEVFKGPQAVISEGKWIDRPSVSMPAMYVFAGTELSEALKRTGRASEANAVFSKTRDVAKATGLQEILRGSEQAFETPTGDSPGVPLKVTNEAQPKVQSSEPVTKAPKKK